MIEPGDLAALLHLTSGLALEGKHVVVTAGPTYEDIDPVRYIGNRSSGKMGFAVSEAAALMGARVSLVAGPVKLATPAGVQRTDVRSARDMRDAAVALAASADVFIGVAAVADFTPEKPAAQKIKKGATKLKIDLVRTPDILGEVAALKDRPFTVGFAAETEKLREHALEKLSAKRLDMIAANRVGRAELGFDSEYNEILVFAPGYEKNLGTGSKQQLARLLMEEVAYRLKGNDESETCPDKSTRPAAGV